MCIRLCSECAVLNQKRFEHVSNNLVRLRYPLSWMCARRVLSLKFNRPRFCNYTHPAHSIAFTQMRQNGCSLKKHLRNYFFSSTNFYHFSIFFGPHNRFDSSTTYMHLFSSVANSSFRRKRLFAYRFACLSSIDHIGKIWIFVNGVNVISALLMITWIFMILNHRSQLIKTANEQNRR